MIKKSIICKHCGSKFEPSKMDTKTKGPHIGLYCSICGNYIKWISKKDYKDLPDTINNNLPDAINNNLPDAINNNLPDAINNNLPDTINNNLPDTINNNLPDTISDLPWNK